MARASTVLARMGSSVRIQQMRSEVPMAKLHINRQLLIGSRERQVLSHIST